MRAGLRRLRRCLQSPDVERARAGHTLHMLHAISGAAGTHGCIHAAMIIHCLIWYRDKPEAQTMRPRHTSVWQAAARGSLCQCVRAATTARVPSLLKVT